MLVYDIEAYLGDTLDVAIGWKDASGAYVDFTGCTGLGQLKVNKTDTSAAGTFTVTLGAAANNLRYSLTAAQVLTLGVGRWYYDIQITHTDGSKRTYVTGRIKTTQDVSR